MQYGNNLKISLFEGYCKKDKIDGKTITIYISGHLVKVKVAANEETKQQGFMNQDEPDGDQGMLFVYDTEEILRFWMKNVNFPLDIIFFDSNMEEVDRMSMEPYKGEHDNHLKIYMPKKPARFAVELPAGWCESNLKDKCNLKF